MKIYLKIISVLFFLLAPLYAHGQAVTWQKWYDYKNYDNEASDAIQTFDGGFLILTNNFVVSDYSILLIKVDYLGNIEWQKLINDSLAGTGLSCFSVSQAIDSGYTISGFGTTAILLKTDSKGNVLWLKNYTRNGFNSRFFDHKNTSDNGIIAIGELYSPFNGYLVKTDGSGIIQWDSIYNLNLGLGSIIESKLNKSYYFTGGNTFSKIDSDGRLIWTVGYNNIGEDILQSPQGDIYCGGGNNDFYLTKFDASGNFIWQKTYNPDANFTSFCLSKDGNILMTGFKESLTQYNIVAIKVDTSGSQIFNKIINSFTGIYFALPRNVNPTNDSGFFFPGITDFPNTAMLRDNSFALKSDSVCNAPKFVGIYENIITLVKEFTLNQNYPNPFNSSTTISFELNKSGLVNLDLFNIDGRKITNILSMILSTGNHKVLLKTDELELASGIYYVRMSFYDPLNSLHTFKAATKKIILLK